jgi:tetratricopeptide (TPR) repeat protein
MKLFFGITAVLGVWSAWAQAPHYVVARQDPAGAISFTPVEIFTIGGKDALRLVAQSQGPIGPKVYGKLPKLKLLQAGTIRRDGDLVVQIAEGKRAPVLPDQLKIKQPQPAAALWRDVRFAGRRSKKDKAEIAFGIQEFFALISGGGGAGTAVGFVLGESNFNSLQERLNAITGVVHSFPKDSGLKDLRLFLEHRTQEGLEAFEAGGPYDKFLDTLKYADVAADAFPDVVKLTQSARTMHQIRASIEGRTTLLQSLYNSQNWDEFLDKYTPLEPYQASFPKMIYQRRRAFRESARLHVQRGKDLAAQKNYVEALKELRMALRRDPSNKPLQDLLEETRIEGSAVLAQQKVKFRKPLESGSAQEVRFSRSISFAERYIADKKFAEAEQELATATELDRESPRILLAKAKIFNARNELARALAMLNGYDESVVTPEEHKFGEEVRIEVAYNLKKRKEENKTKLDELYGAGRYSEALELADKSLELDPEDPEFLYYDGILSALLRKAPAASEHLQLYLAVSNSVSGDVKRRDRAYRVQALLQSPRPSTVKGEPNWASGRKWPAGVYYDPESLAFQPHIAAIKARKQDLSFEWDGNGRLTSISSAFDNEKAALEYRGRLSVPEGGAARQGTALASMPCAEGNFWFQYYPDYPQLARATCSKPAGAAAAPGWSVKAAKEKGGDLHAMVSPDGEPADARWQYPIFLSNPRVNPDVLAMLEGPATVGFAGNPYFNPFVWTGLHVFRLGYDKQGRVESAAEVGANRVARFAWDGDRLQSIGVAAEGGAEPDYTRNLSYSGDRLTGEMVNFNGKRSRITYKYQGDKLVEAEVEDSGARDGGRVRFF